MRIGNLYVTWRTSRKALDLEVHVLNYLGNHPKAREVTARMARSEVKSYLAELAEEAEVPFGDVAQFIRRFHTHPEAPAYGLPDADQCPPSETAREHVEHEAAQPHTYVPPMPQPPADPDNADAWHLYRSVLRARDIDPVTVPGPEEVHD